jgi:hypothetical protein
VLAASSRTRRIEVPPDDLEPAHLSARHVLTDADSAYFVHGLGNDECSAGFELCRVPLAGGSAVRLASEPRQLWRHQLLPRAP